MEGRHKNHAATDISGGLWEAPKRICYKVRANTKGRTKNELHSGRCGQELLKLCQFCADPQKNIVQVHATQHCLHHSLTGRGSSMSHCHSRTVQTLQHYVKPSLSALCYIRNWIAELYKVQYGWPGGFVLETTRPLVWKLATNIQNEVKAGLASSMFIKDWEFFLSPSHK